MMKDLQLRLVFRYMYFDVFHVPFIVESVNASVVPSYLSSYLFRNWKRQKDVRKLRLGVSDCYNTCLRLDGERGKHQDKVRESSPCYTDMLYIITLLPFEPL
jgi:hypothetical protein